MGETMTKRRISGIGSTASAVVLICVLAGSSVVAQQTGSVEVTNAGVVTENPRGDSVVLGTVEPGTVLQVVEVQEPWYLVDAPDGVDEWRRAWLHQRYITVLSMPEMPAVDGEEGEDEGQVELRTSIRGFAQIGGVRFTANDSFDAVTGSAWGIMYGGGAQVGFSSGLFFQGSYERYEETGQRVLVADDQIFELGIDNVVTFTPIQAVVGYRQPGGKKTVGYVGAGAGWYRFQEEAAFSEPGDNVDETKPGFVVLGGVEYAVTPWFWVGGEGQWTYIPKILGKDGISEAFEEDDLGGFTIRLKLSFGL